MPDKVDAAGAGVHEEAAPAKGHHFGRLDTELKLMVTFFEQIAETCSILCVPSVDPDAPPHACYQILDTKPPQRVGLPV